MTKGKFIVIEGVDGSGKTTQFNMLHEHLKKDHKDIMIADFPRYYDSVWGKMVGNFLTGKYGKFDGTSSYLVVLPYMIDQYTWSRDIGRPFYERGGLIISNRFFTSNTHQVAKFKGKAKTAFRSWLWPTGYDELGIMKPDLVIFLDVSPEISLKMNKTKKERGYLKGKKSDLAERNRKHQELAYKEYLYTIKHFDYWKKVKATSHGKIDSPEEIHYRVWKIVEKYL